MGCIFRTHGREDACLWQLKPGIRNYRRKEVLDYINGPMGLRGAR